MTLAIGGRDNQPGIRPAWLRPGALAVIIGVHIGAAMVATLGKSDLSSPADGVEITIAQGTPAAEQPPEPPAPEPESLPVPPLDTPVPVPEPPPPAPPPEPPPPPLPDPPKREVKDAPVWTAPPKPKPTHPKPINPPPQPVTETNTTGTPEAEAARTQARATYASKVLQEIRNHRTPAVGVGSVGVAFSIGPNGEMMNISVIRSSGNDALDSAALRMVRAATPGPPPDGMFSGSTTINFLENR